MARSLRLEAVNGSSVVEYRLRDHAVERRILLLGGRPYRDGGSDWATVSRADLLALPGDGLVWEWLRSNGIGRSTATSTQPEQDRERKQLLLRLAPETIARLRSIAEERGVSMSDVVTELVGSALPSVADSDLENEDPSSTR